MNSTTRIRFNLWHLLLFTAAIAFVIVILLPFRGMFPPFYYQEYDSVRARLEAIPNLQITDTWKHEDIHLEDCGFDVKIDESEASIMFFDHQNWNSLFDRIDGVRYATDSSEVFVSREQLNAAGIDVKNLTEIMERLSEVQNYCDNVTGNEFDLIDDYYENHAKYKFWVDIRKPQSP